MIDLFPADNRDGSLSRELSVADGGPAIGSQLSKRLESCQAMEETQTTRPPANVDGGILSFEFKCLIFDWCPG
jgi:hypothetical protein